MYVKEGKIPKNWKIVGRSKRIKHKWDIFIFNVQINYSYNYNKNLNLLYNNVCKNAFNKGKFQ